MIRKITSSNFETNDIGKAAFACFLHSKSSLSLSFVFIIPLFLSLYLLCRESTWPIGKRGETPLRAASGILGDDAAAVAAQPTFTSTPLSPERFLRDPVVVFAVVVSRLSVISPPQFLSLSLGNCKRKTRLHICTTRRIRAE